VSLLRHISRANIPGANWRVSLTVDVAQLARPGPTDVGGTGHHRTGAHAASAAAATVHDVVSPLALEQHRAFHKVVRQDRYRLSRRAVTCNIVLLVSPKQRPSVQVVHAPEKVRTQPVDRHHVILRVCGVRVRRVAPRRARWTRRRWVLALILRLV